jgi:predicted nuclease of predicted toxin-antitoxin system
VHPVTAGRKLCIAVRFREDLQSAGIDKVAVDDVIKVNATDMDVAARYLSQCDA